MVGPLQFCLNRPSKKRIGRPFGLNKCLYVWFHYPVSYIVRLQSESREIAAFWESGFLIAYRNFPLCLPSVSFQSVRGR